MPSKTSLLVEVRKIDKEMEATGEDISLLKEAKNLVAPEYHQAFDRFVNHLEADTEFIAYWENDEGCQKAIRQCMEPRIALIEKMAKEIRLLIS